MQQLPLTLTKLFLSTVLLFYQNNPFSVSTIIMMLFEHCFSIHLRSYWKSNDSNFHECVKIKEPKLNDYLYCYFSYLFYKAVWSGTKWKYIKIDNSCLQFSHLISLLVYMNFITHQHQIQQLGRHNCFGIIGRMKSNIQKTSSLCKMSIPAMISLHFLGNQANHSNDHFIYVYRITL